MVRQPGGQLRLVPTTRAQSYITGLVLHRPALPPGWSPSEQTENSRDGREYVTMLVMRRGSERPVTQGTGGVEE